MFALRTHALHVWRAEQWRDRHCQGLAASGWSRGESGKEDDGRKLGVERVKRGGSGREGRTAGEVYQRVMTSLVPPRVPEYLWELMSRVYLLGGVLSPR